ncbi:MAG: NAD(P)-binding domain-containing protein, partial [Oscillospiraceae bacterium]
MLKEKKIGFIGAGQMCEAIFSGVLKSNALPPQNVFLTDVSDERLNSLKEKYGILPLN